MNKIEVKFPNEEAEQTAVAEVLTEMDMELAALEQVALKPAMMQELLNCKDVPSTIPNDALLTRPQ